MSTPSDNVVNQKQVGRSRLFLERRCKTKVSYNKKRKSYDDDDSTSIAAAATDRLSNLPEDILHHILTRLCIKEVVKTCILSKTLLSLWLSFPVLDFDHCDSRYPESCITLDKFLNLLKIIMQQRSKHAAVLQKFRLSLSILELEHNERSCVDEAISLAMNSGVKELVLDTYGYSLPDTAFARSITSLTLVRTKVNELSQLLLGLPLLEYLYLMNCPGPEHFKIVGRKIKSFHLNGRLGLKTSVEIETPALQFLTFIGRWCHCHHFSLNSSCNFLKELELNKAPITDSWIENLLRGLVLLEKLNLTSCNQLKNVKVSNLNLKRAEFASCKGLQVLEVRVTDLEYFMYIGGGKYDQDRVICNINIIDCKHLRQLELAGYGIPGDFLQEQVSKLLELDRLHVEFSSFPERVEITHENLKHLKLRNLHRLIMNPEVRIYTPRLVSFTYCGIFLPLVSFRYSATLCAKLSITNTGVLAPSLFEQCYELIRLMGGCKVMSFHCNCKGLIFTREMRKVLASPLVHLKHMRVVVDLRAMTVELVDSLLWLSPYLDTLVFVYFVKNEMVMSIKFEYEWTTEEELAPRQRYSSRKVDLEIYEGVEERANLFKYFKGDVKSLRIIKWPAH